MKLKDLMRDLEPPKLKFKPWGKVKMYRDLNAQIKKYMQEKPSSQPLEYVGHSIVYPKQS